MQLACEFVISLMHLYY